MKNWWKLASVLLLMYVIVMSLLTPLGPGISSVSQEKLHMGKNDSISIYGYNTDFTVSSKGLEQPVVWLEIGAFNLQADTIRVISKNEISADFSIPYNLPSKSQTLHVQYAQGHYVLPNAFRCEEAGKDNIEHDDCEVKNPQYLNNGMVFPNREILGETIRNLMFHVPMWFTMMLLMTISVINSIRYLSGFNPRYDLIAKEAVKAGLLFGILGLATGSLWARFTWGHWWVSDTKLNGAAITTLIYMAYLILRGSVGEEQNQARVSAVYNIFAFMILVVMLMILPRITDSLHPGNGGNPAFSQYDLDSKLRMVFYPAVLGWIGIGYWIFQIRKRIAVLGEKTQEL